MRGLTEDPYAVLGIPRDATPGEIKRAYRRKVFENHPDRTPHDARAAERFRLASAAYERLREAGWYIREAATPPHEPSSDAAPQRPEHWADGEPIHYPSPEECKALALDAKLPKMEPHKKVFYFLVGTLAMYYLLETARGGESGTSGAIEYYERQNKPLR